jgi:plasmid stabilization system protein ParE
MSGYILSPECEEDLFEIWQYLAVDTGPELADRIEAELFSRFVLLARSPGIGHERRDLSRFPVLFYRAFPYQYMIVYRRTNTGIEIVAVLHAKRDTKRVLGERQG